MLRGPAGAAMPPPTLAHDDLGRGPPWVLLHGFPLTRALWQPQHALAERAHLLIPDLPGFGASPGEPASMEQMAREVLALADARGLARFGLAGLSLGGYVALAVHRLAPGRVAALVLADTQAGADTAEARAKREALAARVEAEGIEVLVRDFAPNLLRTHADQAARDRVAAMVRDNQPKAMAAALRAMGRREDQRQHLRSVACPTLVLVGAEDTVIPLEKHEEMLAALPRGRLRVLPGAGHLSNLEAPEAFNDYLGRFIAETQEHLRPAGPAPTR